MSADNGVYILKCKDQFRVKHLNAIDNIHWSLLHNGGMVDNLVPSRILQMFWGCRYTKNIGTALEIATKILRALPVCEYGIQYIEIEKTWAEIEEDGVKYAIDEISDIQSNRCSKCIYSYDLSELRNIVDTYTNRSLKR